VIHGRVHAAPRSIRSYRLSVVSGYLTRVATARGENIAVREKWETTRPPISPSRGLPAMLGMVFASRYVGVALLFTPTVMLDDRLPCPVSAIETDDVVHGSNIVPGCRTVGWNLRYSGLLISRFFSIGETPSLSKFRS